MKIEKKEIERKFLLKNIPLGIDKFKKSEITQTYISFEPELRVRKKDDKYILTKKVGTGMVRDELKFEINSDLYAYLIKGIEDRTIYKTRYYIPLSAKTKAEVDIYRDKLDGLLIVEVEFDTIEEAINFEVPDWFHTEVTLDEDYKNANLSKLTTIDGITKKKN